MNLDDKTKFCIYCGKEIKFDAKKCKYCHEFFEDNLEKRGQDIIPQSNQGGFYGLDGFMEDSDSTANVGSFSRDISESEGFSISRQDVAVEDHGKFCSRCGKNVDIMAKWCDNCGEKFENDVMLENSINGQINSLNQNNILSSDFNQSDESESFKSKESFESQGEIFDNEVGREDENFNGSMEGDVFIGESEINNFLVGKDDYGVYKAPEDIMEFYCPHCGEKLENEAVFCSACGMKIQKDLKKKSVIGILPFKTISLVFSVMGIVLGIISVLIALMFNFLSAELIINAGVALVASLIGVVAIWLSNKDYRVAFIEYLIAAMGLLVTFYLIGIIGAIFFIIAAILLLIDKRNIFNEVEM